MTRSILFAAAALALAGCDVRSGSEEKVDTAAIEQHLKGIEGQWQADYNARDAKSLAGHYAPDSALANPGIPIAVGTVARAEVLGATVADPNLRMTFASDRVQVAKSGDLAYTRGHYTMQTTDPATKQPRSDSGSYLTVWQKQPDGSWKAVEDFVTPGAPTAAN